MMIYYNARNMTTVMDIYVRKIRLSLGCKRHEGLECLREYYVRTNNEYP